MDLKPIVLLATVVTLFAGCAQPIPADPPADPFGSADASPPGTTETPRTDAVSSETGVLAPTWNLGDWWTFRIGSTYAAAREITTIVVGVDQGSYAIAADEERTALETIWWHFPPIGIVDRTNLAWEAHDEPMAILQFPLEDGARWTGSIEGYDVDFAARRTASGTFEVLGTQGGDWVAMRYVYDPALGQLTNATLQYGSDTMWSTLELVASGTGWDRPSYLPMYDDAFLGGFGDPTELNFAGQFEVSQEVTHVAVGCLAEGLVGDYRVHVSPPQGEAVTCGATFATPGTAMQTLSARGAPGTWRIVPTVVGPGSVFVEVANVWLLSCQPGQPSPEEIVLLKPHGNCRMEGSG